MNNVYDKTSPSCRSAYIGSPILVPDALKFCSPEQACSSQSPACKMGFFEIRASLINWPSEKTRRCFKHPKVSRKKKWSTRLQIYSSKDILSKFFSLWSRIIDGFQPASCHTRGLETVSVIMISNKDALPQVYIFWGRLSMGCAWGRKEPVWF